MADRSPEGQLEIAGGACAQSPVATEMFIENLNDHASDGGARIVGRPRRRCGQPNRPTSRSDGDRQFVPFMSDYKF